MTKTTKHTYTVHHLHPQQAQVTTEEVTRSIYRILLRQRKISGKNKGL